MGNIRLNGSTSGYVELQAPAVAGASVIVLPTDTVTPGMVLVGSSTFSAAASVSINNCFSSSYDNYRLLTKVSGGTNQLGLRLRLAGTDNSAASYQRQHLQGTSTTITAATGTDTAMFLSDAGGNHASVDLFDPALAVTTKWSSIGVTSAGSLLIIYGGMHNVATAYDGFTLLPMGGGTITGTVRVYGYRN